MQSQENAVIPQQSWHADAELFSFTYMVCILTLSKIQESS